MATADWSPLEEQTSRPTNCYGPSAYFDTSGQRIPAYRQHEVHRVVCPEPSCLSDLRISPVSATHTHSTDVYIKPIGLLDVTLLDRSQKIRSSNALRITQL